MSATQHKLTTCLWFDGNGAEAAEFYINLFNGSPHASKHPKSQVNQTTHYHKDARQHCHEYDAGHVLAVNFSLAGHDYMALNGGDMFKFTPAISLMVECEDQAEIDHFFDGFKEGKDERMMECGWVNDRYGLSWQVVPKYIRELVELEDKSKYDKLNIWMMKPENMAKVKKYNIEELVKAVEGTE